MGYTTDFSGEFRLRGKRENFEKAQELINGLADTRRMERDLSRVSEYLDKPVEEYGVDGEFFYPTSRWPWWECCGQGNDPSITSNIHFNTPPADQPSLWLSWRIENDEDSFWLEWDGSEKFYRYDEWLRYLYNKILKPNGIWLEGEVDWQGENDDDRGFIEFNRYQMKVGYFNVENDHYSTSMRIDVFDLDTFEKIQDEENNKKVILKKDKKIKI